MSPNMIEEARKAGGEELVAKLMHGETIENRVREAIRVASQAELDGNEDTQLTLVAICEATSEAAAIAVMMLSEHTGLDEKEASVLAFKSLAGNLREHFETLAAKQSGVGDKIMAAAKNGGAK